MKTSSIRSGGRPAASSRDARQWRKDQCGAWIFRPHFRNNATEHGWKIENTAAGGPDVIENLRPFYRANGFDIENARAHCSVVADRDGLALEQEVQTPRNKDVRLFGLP